MASTVLRINASLLVYNGLHDLAYSDHPKFSLWLPASPDPAPAMFYAPARLSYVMFLQSTLSLPGLRACFSLHVKYHSQPLFTLVISYTWPLNDPQSPQTQNAINQTYLLPIPCPPHSLFCFFGNGITIQSPKNEVFGVPYFSHF